jgi:hypothetical protein
VHQQRFILIVIGALLLGSLWEFALSAQDASYADGICTALGLASLSPNARAMRLFHWVSRFDDAAPPVDPTGAPHGFLSPRQIVEHPVYYREDCGSNAWFFGFLAWRAGLRARELRLCDAQHNARHVVCELWLNGRWAVFDPTVELDFRRRDGSPATALELQDPSLLAANVARDPAYDLRRWRFDHPERLHFEKIPLLGSRLRWLAARVTGRPAEELTPPPLLEWPRLFAAASLALLAALCGIAGRWSARRSRLPHTDRPRSLPRRGSLALPSPDQD